MKILRRTESLGSNFTDSHKKYRSRSVLKALNHRKNNRLFYGYLRKFFYCEKDTFCVIVYACGI